MLLSEELSIVTLDTHSSPPTAQILHKESNEP